MTELAEIAKSAEKSKLMEYLERKLEQVTKPSSAEDLLRFLQEIDIVIKSTDGNLSSQDIPKGLLTRLLYKVSVTVESSNPVQQHFHDKLHSILCDSDPSLLTQEYSEQQKTLTQKMFGPKQRSEIALSLEKLTTKMSPLSFSEVGSLVQKLRIAQKLTMRSDEDAQRTLIQVGNKYHTFMSELSTMPQKDREALTFNRLVPMLQEHALEAAQARPAEAHATSVVPPAHAHAPIQPEVENCSRCHRPGHSTKVCHTRWCKLCNTAHGAHASCKGTKNAIPSTKGYANVLAKSNTTATLQPGIWAYDSAASHHLTGTLAHIVEPEKLITPISVNTASGQKVIATHRGRSNLLFQRGAEVVIIPIYDVLYSKEIKLNLLTDKSTTDTAMWTFTVGPEGKHITIPGAHNPLNETVVVELVVGSDGLTYVSNKLSCASSVSVSTPTVALSLLHHRLGHLNYDDLAKLCTLTGTKLSSKERCFCDSCAIAKSRRASVPAKAAPRQTKPGEIVHCDVIGPNHDAGLATHKFFLLLVDDATRYIFLYPMAKKSDATEMIKRFVADATQLGILGPLPTDGSAPKPRTLQTDNDSVLVKENKFVQELARHHIKWRASPPYTQAKNGIAERAILTLKNMARSMLTAAKKSNRYWGAALMHAGYLRCRSPHTALQGKTPYEMVHAGKPPEIGHLRTFGCDAFPHVHTERQAWEQKAKKGTYIGYNDQNQSHIIAFDDVGSNYSVVNAFHVTFNEGGLVTKVSTTQIADPTEREPQPQQQAPAEAPAPPAPATGAATQGPGTPLGAAKVNAVTAEPAPQAHPLLPGQEPRTVKQAFQSPQASLYQQAFQAELEALRNNDVFEEVKLTDVPQGTKILRSVVTFKHKSDNRVKARICVDGSRQRFGEDYDQSYAPVAMATTFRAMLSTAAATGAQIHKLDITSAFLNGPLKEECLHVSTS